MWDYTGGFGLFENNGSNINTDLNVPLVDSMGLTAPEQVEYIPRPDSTSFYIYSDYIEENIDEDSWMSGGQINFYSEDARLGERSIHWSDANQYNRIGFRFDPVKDLSLLLDYGYGMHFWIRGNAGNPAFHLRFLDTKTDDPDDHPWRMHYNVTHTVVPFDGAWHEVFLPLSSFTEQGSWDNDTWYNPEGKFDWTKIQNFEIVAEVASMNGYEFWFDNIGILDVISSIDNMASLGKQMPGIGTYPNPFRKETTIRYSVRQPGQVELTLYNLSGQVIRILTDGFSAEGIHTISWDGTSETGKKVENGMYVCRFVSGSTIHSTKIILIR
jgi:endoglucanase